MIKELCYEQIYHIIEAINALDEHNLSTIIDLIKKCQGTLYFTGIGKNGHVAAKTASTFASIGIKSIFINPVDAVHGDMGNIEERDIIFAISKSGNTKELIDFIENVKKNVFSTVILLHSSKSPKILEHVDYSIYLDIKSEIDQFNIVPTTSISAYTIFLQSLGIEISKHLNFSLKKFKKNHPSGNIGQILEEI